MRTLRILGILLGLVAELALYVVAGTDPDAGAPAPAVPQRRVTVTLVEERGRYS